MREYLLENGYIHPRAQHTKPEGIWRKLQSLYDLKALDEREDARQLSDLSEEASNEDEEDNESDIYSVAENKIHNEDFALPDDDYAEAMWAQRFASETERKDESPPQLPELNMMDTPPVRFTPSFSVEPSEAPTHSSARPARGRGRGRGSGRAAAAPVAPRRSIRQAESSSVVDEQEDQEQAHEEDNDEEEEESEGHSESRESTPAPRSTRSKRGRGGGPGRHRGRGRGRGK